MRAPAPAPTLSRLTARSDPSFRGRGSSLGRSPGRPPSWSSPSSRRTSSAQSCFPSWGPGTDGRAPVGAEYKADLERQVFDRLSQRGPAGQVVTVPESARGCGHSMPNPGTHCRGCDRAHSPGGVGTQTNKNRSAGGRAPRGGGLSVEKP